ncbi:MAG: OmpA family protein, partial [Flavobacteriaceae bacterium]
PAKWNSTNSVEVVTLEGIDGKWVKLVEGEGAFVPDFITEFPDNFTLEFDVVYYFDVGEYGFKRNLDLIFSDIENPSYDLNKRRPGKNGFVFTLSGGISYNGFLEYQKYTPDRQLNTSANKENQYLTKENLGRGKVLHVSIWRQKQRMRIYFDKEKVFDIPRAFEKGVTINTARFFSAISEPETFFFVSNLRYAVGKPDVRSKLITEGRLVTYGITFDVNSAQIKPTSYGTLKQIASILREYPDIHVTVVGHTDTDGSEEANLSLSEKRAKAVKFTLINDFSVSEGQLSYKGKGESDLIDTGSSPESKAKNRRVEFIKN